MGAAAAHCNSGKWGARRGQDCAWGRVSIEKADALRPAGTLSLLARERGRRTDGELAKEGE